MKKNALEIEVVNKVATVIANCADNDGWANFANIGKPLLEAGVDFKSLGFTKMRDFFDAMAEHFELRIDDSRSIPVIYVKKVGTSVRKDFKPKSLVPQKNFGLFNWAYMGEFSNVISSLKNLCLEERWFFSSRSSENPYPILSNYLRFTFLKLYKDGNIVQNANYAAFNTGLVDKLYEPIYALFERNKIKDKQEWYFKAFCVAGQEKAGKELVRQFTELPKRAVYFSDYSDVIYDSTLAPSLDWEHIIIENVDRLPFDFIYENKPKDFIMEDVTKMVATDKKLYYKKLADAIKNDEKCFRNIKEKLDTCVKIAIKKVSWNYKTAIPMYDPKNNTIQLLLPLSLVDDCRIDLALITEKTPSGNYLGHTLIPLDWAYNNARLIARPESEWMSPDKISNSYMEVV